MREDVGDDKKFTHSMSQYQRRMSRFQDNVRKMSVVGTSPPILNGTNGPFLKIPDLKVSKEHSYDGSVTNPHRKVLDKRRDSSLGLPRRGSLTGKDLQVEIVRQPHRGSSFSQHPRSGFTKSDNDNESESGDSD